jgi:hypothetical protein
VYKTEKIHKNVINRVVVKKVGDSFKAHRRNFQTKRKKEKEKKKVLHKNLSFHFHSNI